MTLNAGGQMSSLQRFESRLERIPFSGCWIWMGASRVSRKWPYGSFWLDGKLEMAHRAAWQLFHGAIPDGALICHSCDVPLCVNPAHLFCGSAMDNMLDMRAKGRSAEGHCVRAAKIAKLTPEQVTEIRASALSHGKLAKLYGMSRGAIQHIKEGRTWK